MTAAAFRALVSRVPPEQRAIAGRKIRAADAHRWVRIDYWTDWGAAHHRDLAGVGPDGAFDFLPEPDELPPSMPPPARQPGD